MFRLFFTLPILLSACLKDETISGYIDQNAVFHLVEINGSAFTASATITFPEKGKINGQGPCNSYAASQSAPIPWFAPGPIRATRRACPKLSQETEFFKVLSLMTLTETLGGVLILRNDAGEEMVFHATPD